MKNYIVFTFIICLLITKISFSQDYNKISSRTKFVIDSTYNALLKKNKVVGASIAIVENGEIVYATGYGFSDKDKNIKADENTIFRIGSCTKSFTALSIMQLQEKKMLDINNSIKKHLPELKIASRFNDNNEIYIKDMLCHVSGLPCDIMNGFFCDAPPDIKWVITELNKQTTMSPRVYKHAYSNIAYGLLGEAIARTGNTSYSNYVKENIFKPLNMTSSYIESDEKLAVNFSKAYINNKEMKEPLIRDQAAGLIHSNAIDMANYVAMFLGKGTFNNVQVATSQSIEEMEKNHLGNIKLKNTGENWGYGLYSEKLIIKNGKDSVIAEMIGHAGDTPAFHSDFSYIPELNIGVVVLTNTDNGARIRSAAKLLKIYVKETTAKKLNFEYIEPSDTLEYKKNESDCSANEIKGYYDGQFWIKVKNENKIKFAQGPHTIILTRKKTDGNSYSLKARLFKILPLKIKNQEIQFVKLNNDIYIKAINTKYHKEDFIGIKSTSASIPDSWRNKIGNYTVSNDYYKCTDCPYMNSEGMNMEISEKDGFLTFETKGKTKDMEDNKHLIILSDDICVTGGIGRGTGETFKILDNGNIYYSGFEFKKVSK